MGGTITPPDPCTGIADECGHLLGADFGDLCPQRLDAGGSDGLGIGTGRITVRVRRGNVVLPRSRQIEPVVEGRERRQAGAV